MKKVENLWTRPSISTVEARKSLASYCWIVPYESPCELSPLVLSLCSFHSPKLKVLKIYLPNISISCELNQPSSYLPWHGALGLDDLLASAELPLPQHAQDPSTTVCQTLSLELNLMTHYTALASDHCLWIYTASRTWHRKPIVMSWPAFPFLPPHNLSCILSPCRCHLKPIPLSLSLSLTVIALTHR